MDADADARLEDAVALLNGVGGGINFRAIQRVGRSAHKPMRSVARQLRVRVQSDDIAHAAQNGDLQSSREIYRSRRAAIH